MKDEFEVELWEDVKNHPNYEICTAYPYPVRKKKTGKIISECIESNGYVQVWLDGKLYLKHRIIAIQWIYNDDPAIKIMVDHINRDKTDNHINNLRWTTPSGNNLNQSRTKYNIRYVDDLPEDAIEVNHYGDHENISDLYYHDDVFYRSTRGKYKVVNKHQNGHGKDFIDIRLPNGLRLKIHYSKFKREYDLD